jgi:hypothetical protein
MSVIPNKWVKKEKSKPKEEKKESPKHIPSINNSNMTKTLRGVRK